MKKLYFTLLASMVMMAASAQVTHLLMFEELYEVIKAEAEAGGPATLESGNKYLLNADREIGIFLLKSPSGRTFRIDKENFGFVNGITTTVRLEPNGSSNATNGRKIYVACPAPGTLTIGAYTASASRGFTLEKEDGTVLDNTYASLDVRTDANNTPVQTYTVAEAGTVVINPNAGIYYGFVQFVEAGGGTSLLDVDAKKVIASEEYFDLTGRKIGDKNLQNALLIKKTTYTDGTTSSSKIITKKD
jgi:hypothetical protein